MKKTAKKYSDLDEIQKLKISKVFMYKKLKKEEKESSHIVFEGTKMKYLIVGEELIDL